MPLNIRVQWNGGIACVSERTLKTLARRGLVSALLRFLNILIIPEQFDRFSLLLLQGLVSLHQKNAPTCYRALLGGHFGPEKKKKLALPPSPRHPRSAGVHHPASPPRNPPPLYFQIKVPPFSPRTLRPFPRP